MISDTRAAWDEVAGIAAAHEEETSYLREMVFSSVSGWGLFGAVVGGAGLSVFLGLGVAAIPVLGFLTAEAVAAVFLPSSPVFREWADRKKRAEKRQVTRARLEKAVKSALWGDQGPPWKQDMRDAGNNYLLMLSRLEAFRKLAKDQGSSLSRYDVEKLEETVLDYLRLMYSRCLLQSQMDPERGDRIKAQMESLGAQLEDTNSEADRQMLNQTYLQLESILKRRERLPAKDMAAAAQLTVMSETFEELYHQVSSGKAANTYLQEALTRMSIEEELSSAAEEEIASISNTRAQEGLRRVRAVVASRAQTS